jgi:hypothetical protein
MDSAPMILDINMPVRRRFSVHRTGHNEVLDTIIIIRDRHVAVRGGYYQR